MAINLEIVTPHGLKFTGEAEACTATNQNGKFQILHQHASMISILAIGSVRFRSGNEDKLMATSDGFLEVQNDKISIIVESAEWASEIDMERAKFSLERAENRLAIKEGVDIDRARSSLHRAINRIKIAEIVK